MVKTKTKPKKTLKLTEELATLIKEEVSKQLSKSSEHGTCTQCGKCKCCFQTPPIWINEPNRFIINGRPAPTTSDTITLNGGITAVSSDKVKLT